MKDRRHEAEPWRNQSRAPTELFCRGNIPPGGGNHHHRHHHQSSHWEGVNLHQHLHQHHLLSNPSSSLVSNLCLKTSDWYLMTHKYRGSIVVLSISKSVEPNEE